jgi:hypothetical protein
MSNITRPDDCDGNTARRPGADTDTDTPPRHAFALEPAALIDAFRQHPPLDFNAWEHGDGTPLFATRFDLLTTTEPALQRRVRALPGFRLCQGLSTPRTLFAGSTVSEYLPLSCAEAATTLPRQLLEQYKRNFALIIIKDIPAHSPLLSAADNRVADTLTAEARAAGYVLLQGQALAYMPIDFGSIDAWLARFSAKHRYDLRRKLGLRRELSVERWPLGAAPLQDAARRAELYALYQQVYAHSETHFDQHRARFFDALFSDATQSGFLFVFRAQQRIIGWKLCYVLGDKLIDKYVGFAYPEARRYGLFFVSWFECIDYALRHGLKYYVSGWTDAEVKAYLGARFTMTRHAVYLRNPLLRLGLRRLGSKFESDRRWANADSVGTTPDP